MAGCFGCLLAKPASKFPVKRYNILVPDIFPIAPVNVDEDLPGAVKKKIQKLQEYVANNSERTPKVSRRLERKIRKDLSSRKLGSIKIAVHAYIILLKNSNREDAMLYAQELIKTQLVNNKTKDPVIKLLLEQPSVRLRIFGSELLAHFIRIQTDGDNLTDIEELVPLLAKNCRRPAPKELEGATELKIQELRTACLRSIREHVLLMERLSAPPQHLQEIIASVLDNLDAKEVTPQQPPTNKRPSSPKFSSLTNMLHSHGKRSQPEPQKSTSLDFSFCKDTGLGDDFSSASTPAKVSAEVLTALGRHTRAARSAERILSALLRALDERHGWKSAEPVVHASFEIMHSAFAKQHQQFLLFTVLLRHAAAAGYLPLTERARLIELVVDEGLSQEHHFASTVLAQCLTHFPAQLPVSTEFPLLGIVPSTAGAVLEKMVAKLPENQMTEDALRQVILDGVNQVAGKFDDANTLIDELARILGKVGMSANETEDDTEATISILDCVAAALQAVKALPEEAQALLPEKQKHLVHELLALQLALSTEARLHVHKVAQMVLSMGHSESELPIALVLVAVTAICNEAMKSRSNPESFMALSGTFRVLMAASGVKGRIAGLQLVHTLWKAAIADQGSQLASCGAVHRCAVVQLANAFALSFAELLECPALKEAVMDVDNALNIALRLNTEHPGELEAIRKKFPPDLEERCSSALKELEGKEMDLVGCIVGPCSTVKALKEELGQGLQDVISSCFCPDNLDNIPMRVPIQGTCGALESRSSSDSSSTSQSKAIDFSIRIVNAFSRASSWRERHAASPSPKSVRELLSVGEEEQSDDNGKEKPRSRKEALKSVLSMLDDREVDTPVRTGKSLNMDELLLGLDPVLISS